MSSKPVSLPETFRRLLRRAARRCLPREWLTARGIRALLGLRHCAGRPIDRIDGFDVEYSFDSLIGQLLYVEGEFEPGESAFIASRLRCRSSGTVLVDVGANIGLHSLMAARLPEVARVLAFEPGCATFAILERNLARNRLEKKIAAQPLAVSDRSGMATFHFCSDDAYSSLIPDDRRPIEQSYPVRVTSLDEWLPANGVSRIDFIKIDVEGNEPAVIAGARETLLRHQPELMVEIYEGSRANFSARQLIEDICALGYEPFVIVDGAAVPFKRHDDAHFNYYFRPLG